jgi:hypothetical protein
MEFFEHQAIDRHQFDGQTDGEVLWDVFQQLVLRSMETPEAQGRWSLTLKRPDGKSMELQLETGPRAK